MGNDPTTDGAFREVYDATFDDVRRFCLRRLPTADVNDAVSEVYLVAWRKADEIPDGKDALPWLYGVARNVVGRSARSRRRWLRLSAKASREPKRFSASPEVQVVRHAEDEALLESLRLLSQSDQEIIRLRAWEELTAPEIAVVLQCSVAAAEKRVARAFKRLKREFASDATDLTRQQIIAERGEA